LLRGKGFPADPSDDQSDARGGNRASLRQLGILLLLPFAVAGSVSLAHVYPYGGTRHVAFLIIPGVAGVSLALARFAAGRWNRGLATAALVLVACIAFGKTRPPRMDRADQSRAHMADAIDFIQQNVDPSNLIFVEYQTDLILGHYLCQQRPITFEAAPAGFEQFSCAGHRIVSADYKMAWMFWADNFPGDWLRFVEAYNLKPGGTVWIVQSGWGIKLPEDLRKHYAEFHGLQFQSFGDNIKIFKLTVGQPMPAAPPVE
ncbi:MAG: hypothetical protein WCA49_17885, partial [Candidatus Sulfotelmatobacter sp.]